MKQHIIFKYVHLHNTCVVLFCVGVIGQAANHPTVGGGLQRVGDLQISVKIHFRFELQVHTCA